MNKDHNLFVTSSGKTRIETEYRITAKPSIQVNFMSNAVLEWIQQVVSFFTYFGTASMSPQHAHSWVVELQPHNRGHMYTRIFPSSVLDNQRYTPALSSCLLSPTEPSIIFSSPLLLPVPCCCRLFPRTRQVNTLLLPPYPSNLCPQPPHRPLSEVHNWPCHNVSCNSVLPL